MTRGEEMRHIEPTGPSTRDIIFNFLGDYVNPSNGVLWTSHLLMVLKVLGVGERASRSTLSRMKQRGWLVARRQGRRSLYQVTPKAHELLEEGGRRLFGPRQELWDGTWTVVAFSLPGERRLTRHRLHTRLSWLGFGNLLPGTLIAAYPRAAEVRRVLHELEVHPYVHVFAGARLDPAEQDRIVARCWDLSAIDARYGDYLDHYRPILNEVRRGLPRGVTAEQGFVWRFWATYDYSQFPRIDPFLPAELLPRHWRGGDAWQLLTELRALLQEQARQFLKETLEREATLRPRRRTSMPAIPEGSR